MGEMTRRRKLRHETGSLRAQLITRTSAGGNAKGDVSCNPEDNLPVLPLALASRS